MKELTDTLGFYFLVYQRTLNDNFIKCWIDGSEDCIYYTKSNLLDFARQSQDRNLINKMNDSFYDTGIFLWDVEHNYIKRLYNQSGVDKGIMGHVLSTAKELKKNQAEKITDNIFQINGDNIKIFK